MHLDINEHLYNDGSALVLHGEQGLTNSDLAQIPNLSDGVRAKIGVAVLSNTPLTDDGLKHLSALPNLRKLYIQNTAITDRAPLNVFAHNLTVVNLDNTLVGDDAIDKLSLAPNLRVLSARNTLVSDRGIQLLAKSEALQEYDFSGTQVTEFGKRRLDNAMFRTTLALCARWACYSLQIGAHRISRRLWLAQKELSWATPCKRNATALSRQNGEKIPSQPDPLTGNKKRGFRFLGSSRLVQIMYQPGR